MNGRCKQPPPQSEDVAQTDRAQQRSCESKPERHTIEYIILDVARVPLERFRILCFLQVMKDVAELHRPESVQVRTVRIPFDFGKRVMLAVHCHPFARAQTGRDPQTEAEEKRDSRMELERLMSGAAVEKNSGAENRYLRDKE